MPEPTALWICKVRLTAFLSNLTDWIDNRTPAESGGFHFAHKSTVIASAKNACFDFVYAMVTGLNWIIL